MLTILIIIFILQLGALFSYFLSYPNNKDFEIKLAKFSWVSLIAMLGGLAFVFITVFFYGYINTCTSMRPTGYFGIRDLGEIFRSSRWDGFRRSDLLNEFLFGYFITLIIFAIKDVGRKLVDNKDINKNK